MGGMVKGKSDPYVKINIGSVTFKSHVIKENLNPTWNEMYEVGTVEVTFVTSLNIAPVSSINVCLF